MTRDELYVNCYQNMSDRLITLEDELSRKEKKELEDQLEILDQLINEIPMDVIIDDIVTGEVKQEFIGKLKGEVEEYCDCSNFNNKYYFIKLIIMKSGDEDTYKDERLLKLSSRSWFEWFHEHKYKEEETKRIKNNIETYIKVIVVNNEIKLIKWV